uniref:Uncharacterized protein n=1 Tax=Acrobeloides nanus TaxID=290746 RepID=A0A914EIL9_9BILA
MDNEWGESVYANRSSKMSSRDINWAGWLTCCVVTLILLTIWAILGFIAAVVIALAHAINSEFGDLQNFLNKLVNGTRNEIPTIPTYYTIPGR